MWPFKKEVLIPKKEYIYTPQYESRESKDYEFEVVLTDGSNYKLTLPSIENYGHVYYESKMHGSGYGVHWEYIGELKGITWLSNPIEDLYLIEQKLRSEHNIKLDQTRIGKIVILSEKPNGKVVQLLTGVTRTEK